MRQKVSPGSAKSPLHPLIIAAILSCGSAFADAPFRVVGTLEGLGSVVDGDGVLIRGVEVRLQGYCRPR